MTVSDIIYITTTVAFLQGICDTVANRVTFSSDAYKQRCRTLENLRAKRDKTVSQVAENPINVNSNSSAKARDKQAKKLQRAEEDFQTAASNVSLKHVIPNVLTGLAFFLLYKILNLEYQGKIIAVLPFTPWKFLQRFTMRGLKFDPEFVYSGTKRVPNSEQACGFLFVYLLTTMSVKFMVKHVLGTKPPPGADKGMFNMLDDPRGQQFLKAVGVDIDDINEIRKTM